MRTVSLEAVLEGTPRVIAVDRWRKTVTLRIEGEDVTLRAHDEVVLTLTGSVKR